MFQSTPSLRRWLICLFQIRGCSVKFEHRWSEGEVLLLRACLYWNSLSVAATACTIGARALSACVNVKMVCEDSFALLARVNDVFLLVSTKNTWVSLAGKAGAADSQWHAMEKNTDGNSGSPHSAQNGDAGVAVPELLQRARENMDTTFCLEEVELAGGQVENEYDVDAVPFQSRAAETSAINAARTPQPGTYSRVLFSKIGDSQAMRTHHNPQPIPHGDAQMTVHSRTAQSGTSSSQSVTRSCSSTSAILQRNSSQHCLPPCHRVGGEL